MSGECNCAHEARWCGAACAACLAEALEKCEALKSQVASLRQQVRDRTEQAAEASTRAETYRASLREIQCDGCYCGITVPKGSGKCHPCKAAAALAGDWLAAMGFHPGAPHCECPPNALPHAAGCPRRDET